MMKKMLLILGIVLTFASCSLDDDENTTFTTELVPIVSVEIPDTLVFNKKYTFSVTYNRPTTCHAFKGFTYERNGNERIIAVVNAVFAQENCEPLTDENVTRDLRFFVEREDFYLFKFWQGQDENGEPIFLTKKVPVAME